MRTFMILALLARHADPQPVPKELKAFNKKLVSEGLGFIVEGRKIKLVEPTNQED